MNKAPLAPKLFTLTRSPLTQGPASLLRPSLKHSTLKPLLSILSLGFRHVTVFIHFIKLVVAHFVLKFLPVNCRSNLLTRLCTALSWQRKPGPLQILGRICMGVDGGCLCFTEHAGDGKRKKLPAGSNWVRGRAYLAFKIQIFVQLLTKHCLHNLNLEAVGPLFEI